MNDVLLKYRIVGKGYPVVFLHGFLESKSMWRDLGLEKLPIKSILIDLPGHGESINHDDSDPSIEFMAKKVLEVLSFLDCQNFSIIGHSMGGYVALSVKKETTVLKEVSNAMNCEKVILLNSNFWEDPASKKKDRLRVVDIVMKNKNLFIKESIPNLFVQKEKYSREIDELISESSMMDKHSISYASLAMRNRNNHSKLVSDCKNDFLLIQGELDTIIPLEVMFQQIEKIDVQFKIIKNAGHMAHLEAPDEVLHTISAFLNG